MICIIDFSVYISFFSMCNKNRCAHSSLVIFYLWLVPTIKYALFIVARANHEIRFIYRGFYYYNVYLIGTRYYLTKKIHCVFSVYQNEVKNFVYYAPLKNKQDYFFALFQRFPCNKYFVRFIAQKINTYMNIYE